MREGHEQAGLREFALGEVSDPSRPRELESGAELFGILGIPTRVERPAVTQQLRHAHPRGQVAVFREVAQAPQHRDRRAHRVEAEHLDRALLGPQQPQQMLDQRGLPGAVGANQPEDHPPRDLQRNVLQGNLRSKGAADLAQTDHGRGGGDFVHKTFLVLRTC